jgi:uncharacterized iron-regulated membrane protein
MLRKTLFWLHLVCGVVAGLSIGIMCLTGTILAYEKELTAWAERDAREIAAPASGAVRITIDEAQQKLRAAYPDLRPATLVLLNDDSAAWSFPAGRGEAGYYVNPFTGEVRRPASTSMSRFMQTMQSWHRYLGFSEPDARARGKWINGVCNLAFCLLAITGLYLWMPRNWSVRSVKAVAIFNWRLAGKARDFNWHNSIGLWTAPVLIVLTLTAVPISFQWGGRVIAALAGAPATGAAGNPAAGPATSAAPANAAAPLSRDALLAAVQREFPDWEMITLRLAGGAQGMGAGGLPAGRGGRPPATGDSSAGRAPEGSPAPAITTVFTVREASTWPRTATTTVTVNANTGEIIQRTGYAELPAAQRIRSWTRFLHTGEALGWGGQLVAGLACLGGCVLVWTGFTLAGRRLIGFTRRTGG